MSTIHRSYLVLCGVFVIGCSSGGSELPVPPGADFAISGAGDMSIPGTGGDGGTGSDGGTRDQATTADAGADLPCAPSSYRCGPGPSVQICNSTGTAWLFSSSCAVSCSMGLCTGGCTPTTRRCNAKAVETCNPAGTAWTPVETCSTTCYSGACTLAGLDVTASRTLDGEVVVSGDVIVRSGVTVTVPTGNLTLRAHAITIEAGATISVAATGTTEAGRGSVDVRYQDESGGGGGYGTVGSRGGSSGAANSGGPTFGSDYDVEVTGGGPGANSSDPAGGGGSGGFGGGVLRLIADSDISHAGTIGAYGGPGTSYRSSYKGGGGGGSGGGILLLAGGKVTVTGIINTSGGTGGATYYTSNPAGAGGQGRIKLIAGTTITTTSATLTGKQSQGLTPPTLITSTSHPVSSRTYNDDFSTITLSWNNPVASRQGYYSRMSINQYDVPTPASGSFLMTESQTLPATAVVEGVNYFHLVTVDAMFKPSTIEDRFIVKINKRPPTLASSSHANPANWYPNRDVFLAWTFPVPDGDTAGVYYVLDRFGDTVPTKTSTFIPLPQKQVVLTVAEEGVWFMHALAQDSQGYLTRAAAHYRINVGTDPGTGVALGQVTDTMSKPVEGATVSISRGLLTMTTNAAGNYNFPAVPAGTYELRVSKTGYMTTTKTITITKGGSTNTGVILN